MQLKNFFSHSFVNPLIQRYNKFNGKVVKICYCIMVQKAEYKEILNLKA